MIYEMLFEEKPDSDAKKIKLFFSEMNAHYSGKLPTIISILEPAQREIAKRGFKFISQPEK